MNDAWLLTIDVQELPDACLARSSRDSHSCDDLCWVFLEGHELLVEGHTVLTYYQAATIINAKPKVAGFSAAQQVGTVQRGLDFSLNTFADVAAGVTVCTQVDLKPTGHVHLYKEARP